MARWREKANTEKRRGQKVADDLGRKLKEAQDGAQAMEAEKDTWQSRCREAESQVLIERGRVTAAEAQLNHVSSRRQVAEAMADDLARQLDAERRRVDAALQDRAAALEKAREAESVAEEAERGRLQAAAQAEAAKAQAEEAGKAVERTEGWAREVELATRDRVRVAEVKVQEAESRARQAVATFRESAEFMQEVTEASLDAYAQGFQECKMKVAKVLSISAPDLDTIQPGDDDDQDGGAADGGSGPAGPGA